MWIYTADLTYYGGGPIRSDGVGYYVYLPALFLDHDLTMRRTGARSFGGDPAYIPGVRWVRTTVPAGYPGQHRPLDQFGIGEAVLIAPFFAAGHGLAIVAGEPRDGSPGRTSTRRARPGSSTCCSGSRSRPRRCERWFARRTVVLTLVATHVRRRLFNYGTYETTMSHAFSFFLVALTVRLAVAVWERPGFGGACALGASLGLVGLVRLTNLTVIVFCALVGCGDPPDLAARARSLARRLDLLAAGTGVFLLVLMWQLAYWHHITGAVFVNPYRGRGEHLDLLRPAPRRRAVQRPKGTLLLDAVTLARGRRSPVPAQNGASVVPAVGRVPRLATWVVASWSIWWYGASFGMRALVDLLPVLALGLAALVETAQGVDGAPGVTRRGRADVRARGARDARLLAEDDPVRRDQLPRVPRLVPPLVSSPRVVREHAAVDDEVRARDPARRRRGQEEDGVGDVGRRAEPLERRCRVPAGDAFRPRLVEAGSVDQAGETQLTRMPAAPSSSAAARVCITTAALAAA